MQAQEYNGWTNYETWNVSLWMDNDEGSQGYWSEQAGEVYRLAVADKTFTREERATLDLMRVIRERYEEDKADILDAAKLSCSVWSDLLGAALSEVNWHEIAKHLIEAVDKEEVEA